MHPRQEDIAQGVVSLKKGTISIAEEGSEVVVDEDIREEIRSGDQLMMASGMWHQKSSK